MLNISLIRFSVYLCKEFIVLFTYVNMMIFHSEKSIKNEIRLMNQTLCIVTKFFHVIFSSNGGEEK